MTRRHNRRKAFDDASASAPGRVDQSWSSIHPDPNNPDVIAVRAEQLRLAWRPPIEDRIGFLVSRCEGRSVIDVGCVAHDAARMGHESWLHARLAQVADSCVGIDVLESGVIEMRERGFRAEVHDMAQGASGLDVELPVDRVIAGELIEHLNSPEILFRFAADVLGDDGELIITTPNPYSPERVWAGQHGCVWENVDHVLYAFPSGIAELAYRTGLKLTEAFTVNQPQALTMASTWTSFKRWVRSSGWSNTGFTTTGPRRQQSVRQTPPRLVRRKWAAHSGYFMGETFVYVLRPNGIGGSDHD